MPAAVDAVARRAVSDSAEERPGRPPLCGANRVFERTLVCMASRLLRATTSGVNNSLDERGKDVFMHMLSEQETGTLRVLIP